MIIALGGTAARLFGKPRSIQAARKAKLQFESYMLRVTFHPAYARRFGRRKGDVWRRTVADLRRAWMDSANSIEPEALGKSGRRCIAAVPGSGGVAKPSAHIGTHATDSVFFR
jgi:hypothetical protein